MNYIILMSNFLAFSTSVHKVLPIQQQKVIQSWTQNYVANNYSYDILYSPRCLGQETAKGPFGLRVQLATAHLSTTYGGGFTPSL